MQAAVVDSNVLIASANRDAVRHDTALDVVRGADRDDLPVLRVVDYVLAETLNFVAERIGRTDAFELYDRLDESAGFALVQTTPRDDGSAVQRFRSSSALSFVDAALGAYAARTGVEYCYSFDDDLDELSGLSRLDRPVDPYAPD